MVFEVAFEEWTVFQQVEVNSYSFSKRGYAEQRHKNTYSQGMMSVFTCQGITYVCVYWVVLEDDNGHVDWGHMANYPWCHTKGAGGQYQKLIMVKVCLRNMKHFYYWHTSNNILA